MVRVGAAGNVLMVGVDMAAPYTSPSTVRLNTETVG
jgi:hypothetical protein